MENLNSAIAQVNSQGLVSAVKQGKVTITATAKDGSKKYGSITINVTRKISQIKIYRFYHDGSKRHFWSPKSKIPSAGWASNGVAWTAVNYSSTPVYYVKNNKTLEYLLTADANEMKTLTAKADWDYKGVLFYGDTSGKGVPVYRLYNAKLGRHLSTCDKNEVSTLTQKYGWTKEKNKNGSDVAFRVVSCGK